MFGFSYLNCLSQCEYTVNKIDEFDKIVIMQLKTVNIKRNDNWKEDVKITLSREGNTKYVEFTNFLYEVSLGSCTAKIKLENGVILIFKNTPDFNSNRINVKGKLLPNEIKELKKSPIDIIRFEIRDNFFGVGENSKKDVIDYKATEETKNYFINNLDCLN